jgi:hypothetical protein
VLAKVTDLSTKIHLNENGILDFSKEISHVQEYIRRDKKRIEYLAFTYSTKGGKGPETMFFGKDPFRTLGLIEYLKTEVLGHLIHSETQEGELYEDEE